MKKSGLVGGISLAVIIIAVVILLGMSVSRVPAGYVAVQYNMNGGVKDDVLTQGWHLIAPSTHTTLYTVGIEQSYLTAGDDGDSSKDESFTASSSEGKAMTLDLTFTYQYQQDSVTNVFTEFKGQSGKEVRDSFIKPNIISWTKEIVAKYKVSDILGSERANVNLALTEYLAQKFEAYGITISNVSLINIEVDEETQEAINAKITAQQNAETQAINNQTAIDKAEAEAKVKLTDAQAEADATKIKAEAEAEANKKLAASITQELIDNNKVEKWNGELPQYMGDDLSLILNNSSNEETETTDK
jgi:regulator of protease activity HflC (stomatin/prohibitin superfamily)